MTLNIIHLFEKYVPMIGNVKTKKNYNRGSNFVKIKCHLSLKRMTKFYACRVEAQNKKSNTYCPNNF